MSMVSGDDENEKKERERIEKRRRTLLGIGFWVQGMRCMPWLAVIYFLKHTDPCTLQILQNSSNLPMVAKPFYGILSDSFCISAQHRLPYIAFGAFLQALSWLSIAFLSPSTPSFFFVAFYLLLGNLGAAIAEVANDAIVAETAQQYTSSSTNSLQSFVWMASSFGGVLGNLVAALAIGTFSPQAIFFFFGILVTLQFLATISIHENSLHLPNTSSPTGIKKQLTQLLTALQRPEISHSIGWFAASYAIIPALTGTMFFYQSHYLKIETWVLGISKVIGQIAMLLWGIVYDKHLKPFSPRKVVIAIQLSMSVLMLSDVLFVKGVYRYIGLSDSIYVAVFSGFLEVVYFFKILPFSILIAQLCPRGCEGSVMAFLMSAIALAFIVSGYLGVALASYVGVTGNDFSGLSKGLIIQAISTVLPLYWSSCIPDVVNMKTKRKEN